MADALPTSMQLPKPPARYSFSTFSGCKPAAFSSASIPAAIADFAS
jgi:hypothetical protein